MRKDTERKMEDWLASLASAKPESGDAGATTQEIVDATGKTSEWVREQLHALKVAGRLVIGTGRRENLVGRMIQKPVFMVKTK